jgi:diguanylate cyclase (GGDEF)-like protein
MQDIKSVLIVDSDEDIRGQLMNQLKSRSSRIFLAADGKSAMEIFISEEVNILIVDTELNDISGLDILKKCKEKKPHCEVIITGRARNPENAIQSLRRGAIDYLKKPIEIDELLEALGRAHKKISEKGELCRKSTILVIDDEEQIARRVKKFLEKEGYSVFIAFNGEDGINIVENNPVDIIVTDIKMDGMNGIEVLQKAKTLCRDIEGIMVTGYKEEDFAKKSLRTGAIDYLTKPIDLVELLFSINRAIRQQMENKFREMALFDSLTGLPNRVLFMDRLSQTLSMSRRYNHKVGLLFLDLDRFKNVNDTLGHAVGDMLLKETAVRLRSCVRESDTVARLGGDEFTIILTQIVTEDDAAVVAKKVIETLSGSFKLGEHECSIGTSIGISTYPSDADSPEILLKNADAAMYNAKDQGRNNYQFFKRDGK